MNRWFRMYDEVLDNPKVQRLSGNDFKAWVNILCLASRAEGQLPSAKDIAFSLRIEPKKAAELVTRLVAAGLIVANDQGFTPHKWSERQYKSDVSTDRVKRFRQRSKTVAETPPDTDSDTDTSVTNVTGESSPPPDPDKLFWDSAKSYLGKAKSSKIGQWVRDFGRDRAAAAIAQAQVERAVDPVAYIEAILRKPSLAVVGGDGW